MMNEKIETLKSSLNDMIDQGICLAFSGGVDSALLLALASLLENGKENLLAATFSSDLQPIRDIAEAEHLAKAFNVQHIILNINTLSEPAVKTNQPDRCYHCKLKLFSELCAVAGKEGLKWVIDGTNADDLKEYRPGLKALQELKIRSPLAELGFSKADVRQMAEELGLTVSEKPSSPCLATRLPYGAELSLEILQRIERAEAFMRDLGFNTVRIRFHDPIARIEVPNRDFDSILEHKDEIISNLKKLGFLYVSLDLEGFRSGSMDLRIISEY